MFWNSEDLHLLSSTRLLTLISSCIGMSLGSLPNQKDRCKAAPGPGPSLFPHLISECLRVLSILANAVLLRFDGQYVSVLLGLQRIVQSLKQATSVPCNCVLLMPAVPGSQKAPSTLPMPLPFALMHRLKLPLSFWMDLKNHLRPALYSVAGSSR
jgi:hypothetical protein